MRTGGEKVAASRTMPSCNSFVVKTNANGDDPRVKAMWDEEFFGHELPPNYKIARVRTRDGQKPRKAFDGGCDVMEERALWDEFLGHNLPPNYVISRFQPPGAADKKGSGGRPVAKDTSAGQQQPGGSNRHSKFYSEDTLEFNFDKTVDSYVLSEEISGPCKETTWVGRKANGDYNLLTTAKDESGKIETFEERALRFGVEDWNLVGNKKWLQNECKGGSKRSTRRGIFHSPSGSDTSSMISTLESSSFSCGSEGSSFAKTDYSSSSFNLSHVYPVPGSAIPFATVGRQPSGLSVGRTAEYHETEAEEVEPEEEEEQFVELNIVDGEKLEAEGRAVKGSESKDGSNYFEFNFLDGKMVESEDIDDKEGTDGFVQMKADDSSNCGELMESRGAAGSPVGCLAPAPAQSPDSDNFFDTSHDSDWSGTHSASTAEHGLVSARDVEPSDYDEDNASSLTDYRPCEDLSIDGHFYEADPPITPLNFAVSAGSKGQDQLHFNAAVKEPAQASNSQKQLQKVSPTAKPGTEERRSTSKSPKKIQGTPRKARSLGSVLSHHLAFTAVPSLRHRSQQALTSDQRQSPAKVTAACIEWLWSEKEAMKPVQALRVLAERENAEKEKIGSSPPVRNLDSAFKETRAYGVGKTQQQTVSKALTLETAKSAEIPITFSTQKDPAKESRESILASWASVYGSGDSSSLRVRRPGAAAKVSLATPALRHCAKGGLSPRKRSISIAAQAGAKSAASYAKQPLPSKSLAVELEVLCRPFGPVLKGVRFLPTAKRGLGRPPLFSNLGPQLASSSAPPPSTSGAGALPNSLKCGRLQCVVSRDGLPSYSLIMEDTEEIFAAKTLRVDAGQQEGVSHVYTFHSFKGKGKGRSGWRQWGKKEKPGSDFAGNMTVTSTICPVVSSNGVQNFVESEFVLFDAKVKEISISCPSSGSPYPRSSFSSWDTATPQRSPQGASSAYSSPSSTYFSLPSPNGAFSTPGPTGTGGAGAGTGATTPTMTTMPPLRNVSLTLPGGVVARGSTSVDKGTSRFKQLERHLTQTTSPLHGIAKAGNFGLPDNVSDSDMTDDCESRPGCTAPSQSQSELAAVVVRSPLEKTPGKTATVADKWGWGINFLRKSFDGTRGGSSPDPIGVASGAEGSPGSKGQAREGTPTTTATGQGTDSLSSESCISADQRCGACGSRPGDEQAHGGGINITLILPSGEHGCCANGVDGPQPLIERWRSGGKCDCGSWDLGCGLTIVGNQGVDNLDNLLGKGQSRDNNCTLRMFVEGKKQQTVGLALTPLKEGCYTLGFQAPIGPLHAFATAVAVLHSRDPTLAAKKAGETKKRLTRIPVKVVPASSRSFTRLTEDPSGSKSFVSYKLVCPDPPASPFGRA